MTLDTYQFILLFFIGCFAGFMNVVAGGGSMITMPTLVFMGLPGSMANGTNRIAILIQNITASTSYYRQKAAEPKLSFTLSLCALPGTIIGAYFGTKLNGPLFNYVLAAVMILVLIYMIDSHRRKKRRSQTPPSDGPAIDYFPDQKLSRTRTIVGHLSMFFVGLYGGFIQAGVGIVIMACLSSAMGMTLVRANIHKVFIIGFYTLAALAIFGLSGDIYWLAGICLACGNSMGALVGTRVNLRGGDRVVRVILYLVIVIMAGQLILQNLR